MPTLFPVPDRVLPKSGFHSSLTDISMSTKSTKTKASLPKLPAADAWERQWQEHWSRIGAPGYELPTGRDSAERELLNQTRYSCAFIVMPGGLGTLDEMFEAATLIPCGKIGPFPLILMGENFWDGMRQWAQYMMAEGVFARDEIGFGHVTDSAKEAVDLIIRGIHPSVRKCLQPLAAKEN